LCLTSDGSTTMALELFMTASPDITGPGQADPRPARASWQRPTLRKLPAVEAEVGLDNFADGEFTES
ncbi:MAG TPA: hypothetical protein VII56_03155, partial [Rhizomicrobium sp.]